MKKYLKYILIFILIFGFIIILVRSLSGEDDWIC
jgi:hypothetical protein